MRSGEGGRGGTGGTVRAAGPRPGGPGWPGHLAAFALCLGLVVLYLWPFLREPARTLPDNTDPRLFTWVLATISGNLVTRPGLLFHGNAFYPLGQSLTFAEPLLTPALLAGPLGVWSGSPVLAYNVTLVLFWALSGWAMYAVARWLTGDTPAALFAALVFTLAPPRLEYYVEFQIEMLAGLPLALYALVRFLETRRVRHLAGLLLAFWLQAIAVWYYAVILGLGLAVVAVQVLALRWRGWSARALAAVGLGGATLGLGLLPVAGPFFVTRRELGFERGLGDIDASRFADVLTYLTTTGTWLRGLWPIERAAETTLFPGALALAAAVLALGWLRGPAPRAGRPERWLVALMGVALAAAVLALLAGPRPRLGPLRSPFGAAGVALLLLGLGRQALAGWRAWQAGAQDRPLGPREWVWLLLGLGGFAWLLSLGPAVHAAGRPLGGGLYAWLYPFVFPLHAIRSPVRFGLLVLLVIALLGAFGLVQLRGRLGSRPYGLVVGLATAGVLLEATSVPLVHLPQRVTPRPVDDALRRAPGDGVVLEWPANSPMTDADAKLRSLAHGRRVVNGFAGFVPALLEDLSGVLSQPGPPFPTPDAQAALRRIHPLRFLVVRLGDPDLPGPSRARWLALRAAPPPLLRYRGAFGSDDLYEVVPLPEAGIRLERWVAYALAVERPWLRLAVAPLAADPSVEQWVDVLLNDRRLERVPLEGERRAALALRGPLFRAAPNVVALRYGYRRVDTARDPRYRIGATGATSPGDLRVVSRGQPHGSLAAIQLDGVPLAPDRRGYNLVALDRAGRVLGAASFDTFADPRSAARLAAWVGALPAGAIVAGAVRDEASALLTSEAVEALGALGVAGDLRGRFREAHAFVGVKGASRGTALEALGPRPIALEVGRIEIEPGGPSRLGLELREFALHAGGAGG